MTEFWLEVSVYLSAAYLACGLGVNLYRNRRCRHCYELGLRHGKQRSKK
jgi:hypothetical protein